MISQLRLYLDENEIIRCGGRMGFSDLPQSAAFPILLPRNTHLTSLIIQKTHSRLFHYGTSNVLAEIRKLFWIPKGRQTVRGILGKCVVCKKVQGRAFAKQPHAPLPSERVTKALPFEVTGLDYSAAMHVKNNGEIVKVYLALFTCAVTRAVHLEIVEDCTEKEFLHAFRRFVARRSLPKIIISDNAKTFEAADRTLKTLFQNDDVKNYFSENEIEWKFIIKRSPWTGGFYERFIGLFKSALKKVLGNSLITLCELRTLVSEIESCMNDRPLTYVSGELNEVEPLTPSHLIYGFRLSKFPDLSVISELHDPTYNDRNYLQQFSKNLTKNLSSFWYRWRSEYLSALREAHRDSKNPSGTVSIGEIVLIHDDCLPRSKWRLGLILDVYKGKDGLVRSASLRTSTGVTNRPISKLYPLEVQAIEKVSGDSVRTDGTLASASRPKRLAAQMARQRVKNIFRSDN